MLNSLHQALQQLHQKDQQRQLTELQHQQRWVIKNNQKMLNLSSNDYLGLASNIELQHDFIQLVQNKDDLPFSASSSRLLTGNFPIYNTLETLIAQRFKRESCLLFNSGYHANIGILPALANKQTLIVADKLVHASIIDGIRLSNAKLIRYRHHDFQHLADILAKYHTHYERIILVTESIFSMDGDICDLTQLVQFKKEYSNIILYVDEAHAIGAYGKQGLGIAEQQHCLADIDILVGTFGKAMASIGAYAVCDKPVREYLVNTMRPLIFSTALPPINIAWSYFLFNKLPELTKQRYHLANLSQYLRQNIEALSQQPLSSQSCIIPLMIGDNQHTVQLAQQLQKQGFYCLPIRPPTVPQGTARIRLSLTADMQSEEIDQFIHTLKQLYRK